ncbi:MAG TPA: tripartite tricarboxylate transporter substrate binding protein [Casimicrobiaceae bacterium]|nr:tripartite tricarboxylate transporter substrate binding protein [Casimicrobiaceae bacterium]
MRTTRAGSAPAAAAVRRDFVARGVAVLAAACILALHASGAAAQGQDRILTLVVGSSPGGGVDRTARLLAPRLGEMLHQRVIVENRDGAGTRLASDYVSKAAPDGNTLMFTTGEATIDLAFDPRAKPNVLEDLQPVTLVAVCQMLLLVNAASPIHSVQDLIARARAAPGSLNYSTAGVKTTMHLVGERFKQRTGTDIVHIPFKGTMPALTSLVAGDVDVNYASLPSALPFIDGGKVRAIALAGAVRSPLLPGVPTLAEAGVDGVDATIWYGLLAPAATSPARIETLARAVRDAANDPAFRRDLATMGLEPSTGTPAAFGAMLRDEVSRYRGVIRTARIVAE